MTDRTIVTVVDGVVTRVCDLPSGFDAERTFGPGPWLTGVPGVQPGWRYDGSTFTAPPAAPVQEAVPARCSKLGLKRALSETGPDAALKKPDWTAVKAAIEADEGLAEDWSLAVEVRRNDPLVQSMIAARKYDDATVDRILIRAVALAG